MISASLPLPVFMKKHFSVPSFILNVIFDVDAEEHPPPPCDETLVLEGSSESNSLTAGSSFMADGSACRLRSGEVGNGAVLAMQA
jgi:hypothetical protein